MTFFVITDCILIGYGINKIQRWDSSVYLYKVKGSALMG